MISVMVRCRTMTKRGQKAAIARSPLTDDAQNRNARQTAIDVSFIVLFGLRS